MKIDEAKFIVSSPNQKSCPKADLPEFAFIGRSNVGKSSLINMLTGRKNLAKTSSTPGKTQLINHFLINKKWYLVDLPGYGWAKVSKSLKKSWGKMIEDYICQRTSLVCTFVLIDIRIPPQDIDVQFINWLGNKELPFVLVFTKADKLSKNQTKKSLETYKKELSKDWDMMPFTLISSSVKKTGKEEILNTIEDLLTQ